jgi:CheY-like chemotaxis protein
MSARKKRILIVDDNASIHEDFKRILRPPRSPAHREMRALEAELFEDESAQSEEMGIESSYAIDSAYQGEEAVAMVEAAAVEGHQYALIFMDVRMPPGMDGIQTIKAIWERYPDIEMVICTAYSDYSWDEIVERFGPTDHLLFLKKPFDSAVVKQVAMSLTTKWDRAEKDRERTRKLEEEIEARADELQRMLAHLHQLKQEAEKEQVARSHLLGSINRDIRTPLNGIMGMTDLLLNTDLDEEQKAFAQTIKRSSDSLFSLISHLSKYLDGATDHQVNSLIFDPRVMVENVAEMLAIRCYEQGLEVGTFISAEVPQRLIGDPEILRQILLILGDRTVSTAQGGTVAVALAESRQTSGSANDCVLLRFSVGADRIVPATENQTAEHEDRFATAARLCRLIHGSDISLEAGEDGQVYSFVAPFQKPASDTLPNYPAVLSVHGIRALILADSATNRKVLSLYINHWGGRTSEVVDAGEALDALHTSIQASDPFDMVIVDLPEATAEGHAKVADTIRCHKSFAKIPLICISSHPVQGDAALLEEAGYGAFLTKPLKQTHLYNSMRMIQALRKRGTHIPETGILTKHNIDEVFNDRYKALVVIGEREVAAKLVVELEKAGLRCDVLSASLDEGALPPDHPRYDIVFLAGEPARRSGAAPDDGNQAATLKAPTVMVAGRQDTGSDDPRVCCSLPRTFAHQTLLGTIRQLLEPRCPQG